tara:strand:+ start:25900 stop:26040 length:141 start_codon:yes stop_codon:yes gene_type:complete
MYVENTWIEEFTTEPTFIPYNSTEREFDDEDPEDYYIEGNQPLDFS